MKALVFTPAAIEDIDHIWDYSANHWGLAQADRYTDEIRDACHALARGRRQGRPVIEAPEYRQYLCGSHTIYYQEEAAQLNVIRILHTRQEPTRHLY